jgi:hypothetical protein
MEKQKSAKNYHILPLLEQVTKIFSLGLFALPTWHFSNGLPKC